MMDIETDNNKLHICQPDGVGRDVTFKWPISQALVCGEVVVVRIDPPVGACDNRNVYGVAPSGEIVWQIEPIKHSYADSPYTGMSLNSEGAVLSNWDGANVVVEPATGRIIRQYQGK